MAKFSVIVPIFNAERYLKQCLDSILNQTYKDIEVILVNDGSTDSSSTICELYKEKDSRVKVVHKQNSGAGHTRNIGMELATGDFITFCDSDDYWDNLDYLEVINDTLVENSNIDMVLIGYKKYFEQDGKFETNNLKDEPLIISGLSKNEMINYLISNDRFKTSANWKIIRRDLLENNSVYFPVGIVAEDIDWGLKVYEYANNIIYFTKPVYVYRQRSGSVSSIISNKLVFDLWSIIKKWIDYSKEMNDISYRKCLFTYLSYQYSIVLGLTASLSSPIRTDLLKDMEKFCWILNYSMSRKTKLVRIIYKIFGFKIMVFFLMLFLKIKNKKKS
ncbi:hypothetical protein CN373_19255 [Bacillus cereus]|uniref:glycosyltransferase family 2 protein n=1 Tax=Bacillus cereus TaxID=1396 RepID=UPI000BF5A2BC|nr:glycosyltransferase [Bacillus cereus]PFA18429.1 hypothetical protein CN373_19255 [Bacillus cereus]